MPFVGSPAKAAGPPWRVRNASLASVETAPGEVGAEQQETDEEAAPEQRRADPLAQSLAEEHPAQRRDQGQQRGAEHLRFEQVAVHAESDRQGQGRGAERQAEGLDQFVALQS